MRPGAVSLVLLPRLALLFLLGAGAACHAIFLMSGKRTERTRIVYRGTSEVSRWQLPGQCRGEVSFSPKAKKNTSAMMLNSGKRAESDIGGGSDGV